MKHEPPLRLCAECGTDLHFVIIDTGQTFYDKERDMVFCSIECLNKNKPKKKHEKTKNIEAKKRLRFGRKTWKTQKNQTKKNKKFLYFLKSAESVTVFPFEKVTLWAKIPYSLL